MPVVFLPGRYPPPRGGSHPSLAAEFMLFGLLVDGDRLRRSGQHRSDFCTVRVRKTRPTITVACKTITAASPRAAR